MQVTTAQVITYYRRHMQEMLIDMFGSDCTSMQKHVEELKGFNQEEPCDKEELVDS